MLFSWFLQKNELHTNKLNIVIEKLIRMAYGLACEQLVYSETLVSEVHSVFLVFVLCSLTVNELC